HVLNKFLRHLTVALSFQHMLMDFHARYILLHNTEIPLENQDHLYMLQIHSLHDPILFSTHREYNFPRTLQNSLSLLLSAFVTRSAQLLITLFYTYLTWSLFYHVYKRISR